MKRSAVVIVVILVLFGFAYFGISWYFSSQIIVRETVPVGRTVDAAPNESDSETRGDFARWRPEFDVPNKETVNLDVNEVTLVLDYYENENPAGCAVIFLHGFSGDRQNVGLYGPMFYELGCDVAAYDARSHGESDSAYMTFGYHERHEADAVLQWVADRSEIDVSQVGMVGISYGAVTALQSLLVEPDIAFVVADSPHQDMRTTVTEQAVAIFGDAIQLVSIGAFAVSEMRADFSVDETSSILAVEQVDTPILILHSLDDTYIIPRHAEEIYEAANPDTTRLILQDYGSPHAESILDDPEAVRADIYAFLNELQPEFGDLQEMIES